MLTLEQKAARAEGIGASECAAVLGISPYTTPYELWMVKTGRIPNPDILDESRVRLRHAHEQTIADEYAFQKQCKLRRVNQTLYHKKYPFMLCHLDRLVVGLQKIVECKTSTAWLKAMWGEAGSDNAPMPYIAQMQHQYAVTGYSEGDMAVLIDIDDFRTYPIQRDESVIKTIEERVEHFWRFHVLEDNPPEPTTRGDIKLMFPDRRDAMAEANNYDIKVIDELLEIRSTIKDNEKLEGDLEVKILNAIGATEGLKTGDTELATYYADKNGKRTLRIKKRI